MFLRKLFKILGILFILLIIGGFFAYRAIQGAVSNKIIAAMAEKARKDGKGLSATKALVYPIGIYFENLSLVPRPSPDAVSFLLDTLDLRLSLFESSRERLSGSVDATLYQGTFHAKFFFDRNKEGLRLQGELTNFNLASYPQAKQNGIETGRVSVSSPEILLEQTGLTNGRMTLKIDGVKKSTPTVINKDLTLSSFEVASGDVTLEVTAASYEVTNFRLKSDLGTLQASRLTIERMPLGSSTPISGKVEITLSERGSRELSGWLKSLFPDDPFSPHFSIEYAGTAEEPTLKMKALN